MDSEVTLQRLRDALGSTLKWTRAAYDSENVTFLNKITVAVKKKTSFLNKVAWNRHGREKGHVSLGALGSTLTWTLQAQGDENVTFLNKITV